MPRSDDGQYGSFICDQCEMEIVLDNPPEVALKEAEENWGVANANEDPDMAHICDDCYQRIMAASQWTARPNPPVTRPLIEILFDA